LSHNSRISSVLAKAIFFSISKEKFGLSTYELSFSNDIDFLEETLEDICQSGFKFIKGPNKQEVVVIPKKQTKQGFFEKFFHFFR